MGSTNVYSDEEINVLITGFGVSHHKSTHHLPTSLLTN